MSIQPELTKKHEGFRARVYKDSRGIDTIGWGFNLEAAGASVICSRFGVSYAALIDGDLDLDQSKASAIFDWQMEGLRASAGMIFKDFTTMPEAAQAVIEDLIFNLGYSKFQGFRKTIAALEAHDWKAAADELTNSAWFHQVGNRAKEDIALLRSI